MKTLYESKVLEEGFHEHTIERLIKTMFWRNGVFKACIETQFLGGRCQNGNTKRLTKTIFWRNGVSKTPIETQVLGEGCKNGNTERLIKTMVWRNGVSKTLIETKRVCSSRKHICRHLRIEAGFGENTFL